jgi:GNAT superfamily N-acetyltransferase
MTYGTYGIRAATARDAPALAALHVRAFQETHGGGPGLSLRQEQWQTILGRDDARDFTLVVEDADGALVAFARGTPHDGGVPGFAGELNKIYVLRRHHRRGLGRLLVCRVAGRFLSQEVTSMLLFGDARSPSNGFYEHLGAERLHSPQGEFHGGYGWRDLRALAHRCADADSPGRWPPRDPAA